MAVPLLVACEHPAGRRFAAAVARQKLACIARRSTVPDSFGRTEGELMSAGRTVGSDEFREALAPMMADIRVFTLEVDAVGPRHGRVLWEDSPAMGELADEPGYQERCSWTGPITDTHVLGGLTLQAAADYVRTFAESFTTESIPMYGHLVVARAALE
jgi:hypothetical protein